MCFHSFKPTLVIKQKPESKLLSGHDSSHQKRFSGLARKNITFSHPDYTVGPGVSPDHAPKGARGLYRRLGIVTFLCYSPYPEGYKLIFSIIIRACEFRKSSGDLFNLSQIN
jgi:hypothetical protein